MTPEALRARLAQDRREHDVQFDFQRILNFLNSKNIAIAPMDAQAAEGIAGWLAKVAPKEADWDRIKVERLRQELGLTAEAVVNKEVSATVDWLIAGHAMGLNALLVTTDKGVEFEQAVCVSRDTLLRVLQEGPGAAAG